ncbi:MAG: hypothetical protein GYB68_09805 [Chloroflexi bacterium]|nr:hypothetical protein [Chloroflexota bacterium]
MDKLTPTTYSLPGNRQAIALYADPHTPAEQVAQLLDLSTPRGVLIVSAGADLMSPEATEKLVPFFRSIGKLAAQYELVVLDGGTKSGGMDLLGSSLEQANHRAPYIGVLPIHADTYRDDPDLRRPVDILEPNHTHFIFVDGEDWGDETKLLTGLFDFLADRVPGVAILANGGRIAQQDVRKIIDHGHDVIILAGSERLADQIADEIRKPDPATPEEIRELARSDQFHVFDLNKSPKSLVTLLKRWYDKKE